MRVLTSRVPAPNSWHQRGHSQRHNSSLPVSVYTNHGTVSTHFHGFRAGSWPAGRPLFKSLASPPLQSVLSIANLLSLRRVFDMPSAGGETHAPKISSPIAHNLFHHRQTILPSSLIVYPLTFQSTTFHLLKDKHTLTMPSAAGKMFRNVYSTLLLIFCTVIVMAVIFDENTKVSTKVHPGVAFVIIWLTTIWLCMVEGGQASLVGLPPVDMGLYKETHKTTHKIMNIVNQGDNLDRYLMGRQFMVLALVFIENLCGDPIDKEAQVLGMPIIINKIFLNTGLALFFMTAMIGKISAQVNASRCMLDYADNFFSYFTFQVARLIEASGLLHCCYPVQTFFAWASGQPLTTTEAPRTLYQNFFFWFRVVISAAILAFSFAVTLSALFNGQTTMWEGVPNGVAVVLFFLFMAIVGMLEGMQIAFFAVAKMSQEEVHKHPWAKRTCDILFEGDGRNLPGFMVGRQMCVTLCFFIVARVTTVELEDDEENIFGVSDGVQSLFDTGILGALITTIVASITWQLVASAFPMAFLSTPVTYFFLRFCLFLEWTGLCQGSWVVAMVHRKLVGFKRDEVYIGTADERAQLAKDDPESVHADDDYNVVPGHLYPGVPTLPADFGHHTKTLEEIEELEKDLLDHKHDVEKKLQELQTQKDKLMKKEANDEAIVAKIEGGTPGGSSEEEEVI